MRQEKRTELQRIFQTITAEEFTQYRKQQGLSQEGMARKLKVSLRTYVDLEHGISVPSATTLAIYLTQLSDAEQEHFLNTLKTAWEEQLA